MEYMKGGESPKVTLNTVEELRSSAKTQEDLAYLAMLEAEADEKKAINDAQHETNVQDTHKANEEARDPYWTEPKE